MTESHAYLYRDLLRAALLGDDTMRDRIAREVRLEVSPIWKEIAEGHLQVLAERRRLEEAMDSEDIESAVLRRRGL